MKKKVLIGVLAILGVGLTCCGYLVYRQKQSYQQYIPKNASTLFRVNVDALLRSIAWNAVLNPGYYFDSDKKKHKKSFDLGDSGLHIPANIFFFTIEPDDATFFSVFSIDDFDELQCYTKNILGISKLQTVDSLVFQGTAFNGKLCLMFTKDRLALCVSASKVEKFNLLRSLIRQEGSMTTVEQSPFYEAIKTQHELVYTNGASIIDADFGRGSLSLSGDIKTALVKGVKRLYPKQFESNSLIKFWLAADITPLLARQRKFFEKHHIPVDTLLRYYGTYMDLEWKKNLTLQQDTIITYDYNDNFERVEQRVVRKERVPEIYLSFQASPHLANYLPKQLFYKFQHESRADRLFFGTGRKCQQSNRDHLSNDFFYLYIDSKDLRNQGNYPLLPPSFKRLEKMEFSAQKLADEHIHLDGKLHFENSSVNGLVQLLRGN